MKAVFLRNLEGFTGHASLYKLDEEVGYGEDWNEPGKFAGYTRYVVVSATTEMGSPETYIFPADEDGLVLSWREMPGSYRGGLSHAKALRRMGVTTLTVRGEAERVNSWTMTTIDDSRISETLMEPILTIERSGDKWGDVIVHKTAEELEQIMRDNPGALGGLARLALEILSLRQRMDHCLHVVQEYVSSELADDPSQDDPSCQLFPLIELVRK